jgi:uncharacterized protein
MASGLLALLDDISTVLDDVAIMTRVAAKKTAGVIGDDLALNAEQVAGVRADRELPVVWVVAKGSLVNKLILVPAALLISVLAPWLIRPLLMVGGGFLCFEGCEKLLHKLLHDAEEVRANHARITAALADPTADLLALERDKIKGAVRTDFVLSAEIMVIALGTVAGEPLLIRIGTLAAIGLLMTVGVYGVVAGIVKLDDIGLTLSREGGPGPVQRAIGGAILRITPYLMKGLSIAGTAAMFLVGGGILTHGIPGAYDLIRRLAHYAGRLPVLGMVLEALLPSLLDTVIGILAGALVLGVVRLIPKRT